MLYKYYITYRIYDQSIGFIGTGNITADSTKKIDSEQVLNEVRNSIANEYNIKNNDKKVMIDNIILLKKIWFGKLRKFIKECFETLSSVHIETKKDIEKLSRDREG